MTTPGITPPQRPCTTCHTPTPPGQPCPHCHTPTNHNHRRAYYHTPAWRKLRTQVLTRDHNQCTNCGNTHRLTAHHITPRKQGGADHPTNLITLCHHCHHLAEQHDPDTTAWIHNHMRTTNPTPTLKLNIGCGGYPLDGYTNVDAHNPNADWDVELECIEIDYPQVINNCTEIRLDHCLEHFSWRNTHTILTTLHNWLTPTGLLRIEVPDMQAIMQGRTGPVDWVQAIYGSHDHPGEEHRAGFTLDTLTTQITAANFTITHAQAFDSTHPARNGLPCLLIEATPRI